MVQLLKQEVPKEIEQFAKAAMTTNLVQAS